MFDRKCRVVLIEDCDDDAVLLETLLRKEKLNIEMLRFSDGVQAFEFLRSVSSVTSDIKDQHAANLVLLDLNLPRMTGKEILKRLSDLAMTSLARFVVLSGSEDPIDKHECLTNGAQAFYVKPWDLDGYKKFVKEKLIDEIRQASTF